MPDDLQSRFRALIPAAPLRGSFFRAIPLARVGAPLSAIGSIKRGGRYNGKGEFEVFYIADRPDNSLREIGMLNDDNGTPVAVPGAAHVLFTVEVTLQHVVDLRDPRVRSTLGVSLDELVSAWRLVVAQGHVPITHIIGAAARNAEVEALLVPSAKYPGSTNLAIMRDRLRRNSVVLIRRSEDFPVGTEVAIRGSYRRRGAR